MIESKLNKIIDQFKIEKRDRFWIEDNHQHHTAYFIFEKSYDYKFLSLVHQNLYWWYIGDYKWWNPFHNKRVRKLAELKLIEIAKEQYHRLDSKKKEFNTDPIEIFK